jgi:hypothetical protein
VTANVFGLGLSAIGLLVITLAGISGWLGIVVISIAVVAFGLGPLFVLGTGLVVGSAPPERAGSAASLSETQQRVRFLPRPWPCWAASVLPSTGAWCPAPSRMMFRVTPLTPPAKPLVPPPARPHRYPRESRLICSKVRVSPSPPQ